LIQSLINGKPRHRISVLDRGLQFGDGVFETLAVINHRPCLWDYHLQRLQQGCQRLGISCPEESQLLQESLSLLENRSPAVLKIIITRGESERGYKSDSDAAPTRILNVNFWHGPDFSPVKIAVSNHRLGDNPHLAGIKHLNRLEQVLARADCPDEAYDALMQDQQGHVIEGIMHNIFVQKNKELCTPSLKHCGIDGVIRRLIVEQAQAQSMPVSICKLNLEDILQADALYLSNSLSGIRAVSGIVGYDWKPSASDHPVVEQTIKNIFK
jgi:4-amino-4-deoxychorismate lyase